MAPKYLTADKIKLPKELGTASDMERTARKVLGEMAKGKPDIEIRSLLEQYSEENQEKIGRRVLALAQKQATETSPAS